MIDEIWFHNFKALRDVRVKLEPFTVFVGPNGSGKTSILEGTALLAQSLALNGFTNVADRPDFASLRSRGAENEVILGCNVKPRPLRILAVEVKQAPSHVVPWSIQVQIEINPPSEDWRAIHQVEMHLRPTFSATFLQLNASRLAEESYANEVQPQLSSDGQGLASVLAYLSMNRPEEFQALQAGLHSVIPSVKRLRLDRAKVNGHIGEKLLVDMENGATVSGHMASAGTLLVVGVLAAVYLSQSPSVLLLDDLDHGLHPKAQKDLILALRKLLAQRSDLQILATSHSPYLVDNFAPEEIRLTTLRDDGTVACASMMDHPNFSKWKDAMSPGEFWSYVGENWITRNELTEAAP
jgi:predicted ATPase